MPFSLRQPSTLPSWFHHFQISSICQRTRSRVRACGALSREAGALVKSTRAPFKRRWCGLASARLRPFAAFGSLVSTHLHIMTAPFHTGLLVLFSRLCFAIRRKDEPSARQWLVCSHPHPLITHPGGSARNEGRPISSHPLLVGHHQMSACGREPEVSLGIQLMPSCEDQRAVIGDRERSLGQWWSFAGRLPCMFAGASILQPGTGRAAHCSN